MFDDLLPLNKILLKVFVRGFYTAHAGMFLFVFLVLFGVVPPEQVIRYHEGLLTAFISAPQLLLLMLAVWLIYAFKTWHYVLQQIYQPQQQFLFYSITSYRQRQQILSWAFNQFIILLPVIVYGTFATLIAFTTGKYASALIILIFLTALVFISAMLYYYAVNRLIDGANTSLLIKLTQRLNKPFFALYLYYVADQKKVTYLVTKVISWLVTTGAFALFNDVQNDVRVAGIAVLAAATAHSMLIFEEHRFEDTYLSFVRNLPYSRIKLFFGYTATYLMLLLPEGVWLFYRFNPIRAAELLLMVLCTVMLFHSLLYTLGHDMEKYLKWISGLFVVIFWIIMFKALPWFIPLSAIAAFLLFYQNYYNDVVIAKNDTN